jgi:hypothetical protein
VHTHKRKEKPTNMVKYFCLLGTSISLQICLNTQKQIIDIFALILDFQGTLSHVTKISYHEVGKNVQILILHFKN